MFTRLVHQATAFSLAAVLTAGILGSINLLATQPADPGLMASGGHAAPVAAATAKSPKSPAHS